MSERRDEYAGMIDAYLDDEMSPSDRTEFERRAAGDESLARELGLQRDVDARLRVLMAAPAALAAPAGPMPGNPIKIDAKRDSGQMRRLLRIAAVLALCAVGAWAALTRPWQSLLGPEPSAVAANVSYKELVKGGLKPIEVCGSDEEFRKYTKDRLGEALTVKPAKGLELVGWAYTGGLLESNAEILMCRAEGKPVIVVMGKKADDRKMHADAGSGVTIHRREVGGVVMYEVSERGDEVVLPLVSSAASGTP